MGRRLLNPERRPEDPHPGPESLPRPAPGCVTGPLARALSVRMVNLLISRSGSVDRGREVGVGALAWLLIPVVAGIVAGLWGSWANRTRRIRSDGPELDGYARFREAMERSTSGT